jgi:hyaluronoglucosaminidase
MTPELGIIEGYFGRAWTWQDRKTVVTRLAPAGYRFFHYAPKIDAKLRRNWQILHDTAEAESIRQFAAHCADQNVRFGIGLSPYAAHIDFCSDTKSALKQKILHLNSLGIEDFALLFDDMRGDFDDLAKRQADIMAFAIEHSTASRFFMCPSYYSNDPTLDRVFGQRPDNYLSTLGKTLDPGVGIYWTGEEVCAREYRDGHLADVSAQLQRKIALWDNYPVNDGPRMSNYLHLRAFTGRPANMGAYVRHHAINPASQPMLGCIPALTLLHCYSEGDAYQYSSAFMTAAIAVCGAELATMLQADMLMLQDSGLTQLGNRHKILLDKYSMIDHPAAREITDWLNGGYAITGEMLQTQ